MKVGFLAPALDARAGGVFTVVEALSVALRAEELADVRCFAPTSESRLQSVLGRESGRLVSEFRANELEIVHLHGLWLAHSAAAATLRNMGIPEVVSPHGMLAPWAMANSGWKKRIFWLLRERSHLERASVIHALCEPEAEAIRAAGIICPVALIPNGIDLPTKESSELPPWHGVFPPGAKVALFLSRMHAQKGALELIEAWGRSRSRLENDGWCLALVGWDDRGYGRRCAEAIESLGLTNTCRWFGPAYGAKKSAAYAAADVFVLPSNSEGLPMAVLEAWAHRKPVLMTNACNLPQGFANHAAQEISNDPRILGEQLAAILLGTSNQLHAMGAAGRALVERSFTWAKVAGQFAELYRWMQGGAKRPEFVQG